MNSAAVEESQPQSKDYDDEEASDMIDCLQYVIHRFSDQNERISSHDSKEFWTSSAPTLRDIVHRYAPIGLESQFEQLYGLLHPCLVARDSDSNAAAFCLGHRGMGKGLLVDRCLQACEEEIQAHKKCAMYRVVQVHGIMIPGNDVGLVVREMLQQLNKAAYDEGEDPVDSDDADHDVSLSPDSKRAKRTHRDENMLRLRMSSFDNNLQLLSETLKLARVDQIPIVVVLDEVDTFLGGSSSNSTSNNFSTHSSLDATRDRQLLLYHLLDRVATQGSNVCLVGLTQHLNWRKQLEKRIKSRMEGTSKEIFVGACPSMNVLISVILSHFKPDSEPAIKLLHEQASQILSAPNRNDQHNDQSRNSIQRRVWDTLEREYGMGRSVRWFKRIFSFALSLYRGEWMQYQSKNRRNIRAPNPPRLEPSHLMDALVAQGASVIVESYSSARQQRKRSSSLVIMEGNATQPPTAVNFRIQALLDLSAPQVALVLAARRILARDSQWNGETSNPPPLTLKRMLLEFSRFKSNSSFSSHLLWMSFQEMLDQGLFRPAADHTGGGPFQYMHQVKFKSILEAEDAPLHLLVDTNRELMEALRSNLLECSTALKEWGLKTNT